MIEKLKNINFPTSELFDNKKIAVILTFFNRSDLFLQVVESLNRCEELIDVPIFLYADGGAESRQNEAIELFKKVTFKNKFLIKRSSNYGCEKNTLYCIDDILEKLNFDFCFLIEDDIKLGKNYFKFCYDSFKHIQDNLDKNIGIFQGHSMCFMSPEEKKLNLNNFEHTESDHHWGFFISKEAYTSMKVVLSDYYKHIDNFPTNGNAKSALLGSKLKINELFDSIVEKNRPSSEYIKKTYYKKQNSHCTLGWDGAFELALACTQYKRYKSTVNRILNLGETGTHFSPHLYKYLKLNEIKLDEVWL